MIAADNARQLTDPHIHVLQIIDRWKLVVSNGFVRITETTIIQRYRTR